MTLSSDGLRLICDVYAELCALGFWDNIGGGQADPFVVIDADLGVAVAAMCIDTVEHAGLAPRL